MRPSMVSWVRMITSVWRRLQRIALQHGVDGDVVLGQRCGDAGQHAGLVGDDETG